MTDIETTQFSNYLIKEYKNYEKTMCFLINIKNVLSSYEHYGKIIDKKTNKLIPIYRNNDEYMDKENAIIWLRQLRHTYKDIQKNIDNIKNNETLIPDINHKLLEMLQKLNDNMKSIENISIIKST